MLLSFLCRELHCFGMSTVGCVFLQRLNLFTQFIKFPFLGGLQILFDVTFSLRDVLSLIHRKFSSPLAFRKCVVSQQHAFILLPPA